MPKPRPLKRLPVRKQIERTPLVTRLEQAYGKNPRKLLDSISVVRYPDGVSRDPTKLSLFRTHVHTHPRLTQRGRTFTRALPSWLDIATFSGNLKTNSKTKSDVVAAVNRFGKVIGYTVYQIPMSVLHNPEFHKKVQDYNFRPTWIDPWKPGEELAEMKRLGIRLRFKPMPGYAFDPIKEQFVRQGIISRSIERLHRRTKPTV